MPDALNYCIIFTDYNIIHRLITNASLCGKEKKRLGHKSFIKRSGQSGRMNISLEKLKKIGNYIPSFTLD